jgi:hypothetical protein
MDDKKYDDLKSRLDKLSESLSKFSPSPSPTGLTDSVGFITSETNPVSIPESHLPVVHSMLHMFAANKSGKGLSRKTIEKLHKEVVKRMPVHYKFDRLDEDV